jgi:hypothetical protein
VTHSCDVRDGYVTGTPTVTHWPSKRALRRRRDSVVRTTLRDQRSAVVVVFLVQGWSRGPRGDSELTG